MKKIMWLGGHSSKKGGATGNGYNETVLARELADMCVKLANEKYEVEAITDSKDSHSGGGEETEVINKLKKTDYFMTIHFNSATPLAKGSEIIVNCKEASTKIEDRILDRFESEVGFKSRGIKRRMSGGKWVEGQTNATDYYGILRQPMEKGIHGTIMEVCFISNKDDMKMYVDNKQKIAMIIVDEVCKGFGLKLKKEWDKPSEKTKMYRVCVGSYELYANASARKTEMNKKGIDAFIVEDYI